MFPLKANSDISSKNYVDDVFSAYTYIGNGSTQTINNGIDLAGKGGMVWEKNRSASQDHYIVDSSRPLNAVLRTNTTGTPSSPWGGYNFNANGYDSGINFANGNTVISWTFRNAFNFFQALQVTKVAGSNLTIDLSPYMTTVGMVRVKRTDAAGSWYTWHRSLPAGQLLIGETTAAATTLGQITVTGTTLTLVDGVIANGTYHVEAYAHDASTDGLIQCGAFTTDASGNATVVTGWEPQWLMDKKSNTTSHFVMLDTMRNWSQSSGGTSSLAANLPNAEGAFADGTYTLSATGFTLTGSTASITHVYCAIRRPNKPPKTGAEVYNAVARTGTGAVATIAGVGFAPDLVVPHLRIAASGAAWWDRLRGTTAYLRSAVANPEYINYATGITAFGMDGVEQGADGGGLCNYAGWTYINHFFRRAPGVFDVVCYDGTGVARTIPHGLGVVPELMIVKNRSDAQDWAVYASGLGNTKALYLNSPSGWVQSSSYWNNTNPSATSFAIETNARVNKAGFQHVAYLFATKLGISKVGSFTGNGTSQNIDCGFTTGARFVLIKRTDNTGDWFVWDSTRGIVAGNDPHLSLNTTAAEVTTDDSVDSYAQGITINQVAATNINVNNATYIYLAYA